MLRTYNSCIKNLEKRENKGNNFKRYNKIFLSYI